MSNKRKIKLNSLWLKLLMPMMVLNIILAFIFYGTIFFGGTTVELEENAMEILSGTVGGRAGYLQQQMNSVWANFDENVREVDAAVSKALKVYDKDAYLEDRIFAVTPLDGRNSISDIGKNYDNGKDYLTEYLLECMSPNLVKLLRQNYVNGAYIVLEGNSQSVQKEGLYFRRTSTGAASLSNADLTLLVAPQRATVDYCADFGTKTNSMDRFFFDMASGAQMREVYAKTFSAADTASSLPQVSLNENFAKNYSYWAPCYGFINITGDIISYNMPLISGGKVYGVIGADINASNIISLLSPLEIMGGSTNGAYVLSVRNRTDNTLNTLLYSGILYSKLYSAQKEIDILGPKGESCYRLEDSPKVKTEIYASIKTLSLYNNNTPYADTVWELAAIVERDELFSFSQSLTVTLIRSLFISLGLSIAATIIFSLFLSRPVKKLAEEVRNNQSLYKSLNVKTNISEIDELVGEIQSLAANVADSASKLEQIIQVANVPIGAFEERGGAEKIFYTGRFFALLEVPVDTEGSSGYMSAEKFYGFLREADRYIYFTSADGSETMYHISERWVRLNITRSAGRTLGVVSDITQEINDKKKLAYERDTDLLTQLLNRRAFYERGEELFDKPEVLKTAAVMVMDLDDLKAVNDNFGHGAGDDYIAAMARILQNRAEENVLISRLSGDEFAAVLYGADDKEQIRIRISAIMDDLKNSALEVGETQKMRISASAGIAWYPEHSVSFHELLRKADIAMYRAKNTQKSSVVEFSPDAAGGINSKET